MRAEFAALDLRRLTWKRIWRGMYRVHLEFNGHDLLSYASSIAFQVLYAVAPLIALAFGGLGIVGAQSVYFHHIAPTLRGHLSPDAFKIADRTARHIMSSKRVYWTSAGLLITIWGISGSVRAMFVPLNRIYETEETRTFLNRLFTSFGVAVIVVVCVYAALIVALGGKLLHPHGVALEVLLWLGRWLGAFVLLLLAIGAIVRLTPAAKPPMEWVSIGAVLSALSWLGASALFAAYISVVSYGSLYGALALVVVLIAYLYYSAVSFLFGIVVDSLLRDEVRKRERRRR